MGGTIVRMVLTRAVVVTALPIGCVGVWSTSAEAITVKPTILAFAAAPTIVRGPSGYVHLSARTTGATSCSFITVTRGAAWSSSWGISLKDRTLLRVPSVGQT